MDKPKFTIKSKMTTEKFFGELFHIRTCIHLHHLSVKGQGSFAAHLALQEFYTELLTLTDRLVETYQGKYGIIKIQVEGSDSDDKDPIKEIEELAKLTDGGSIYSSFKETWIQNQLDEISTLCYQTLYKLKNLK